MCIRDRNKKEEDRQASADGYRHKFYVRLSNRS
jgi:hypothetical protein